MEKEENKKRKSLLVIGGLLIICLILAISYALWQMTFTQSDTNIITTGCLDISFSGGSGINLPDAIPLDDEQGLEGTPYNFMITNSCSGYVKYNINLEILNTSTLSEKAVKAVIDS